MNFPCRLPNVASLCFQWVDFGPINCAIDVPVLENLSFLSCKFLPVNLYLRSISTLDLVGSVKEFVKEFTRIGFQLNVEYLKLSCYEELYIQSDKSFSVLAHLLLLCPKLRKLDIDLFWLRSVATECMDTLSELHVAAQTNKMLHALKLISFRGSHSIKLFLKKLLASFSTLEMVVIVRDKNYCKKYTTGIMQELLDLHVDGMKPNGDNIVWMFWK
nr:F-box/FBD/LRR-repeat protein At1g13570-like [Ipomoea batatas]